MSKKLGDKLAASVRGAKQNQAEIELPSVPEAEVKADLPQKKSKDAAAAPVSFFSSRRVWPD